MEHIIQDRLRTGLQFAAISPLIKKHTVSKTGRAAHQQGLAYQWNKVQGSVAGRKGGRIRGDRRLGDDMPLL